MQLEISRNYRLETYVFQIAIINLFVLHGVCRTNLLLGEMNNVHLFGLVGTSTQTYC